MSDVFAEVAEEIAPDDIAVGSDAPSSVEPPIAFRL